MSDLSLRPIGTIHSPFTDLAEMPIQPRGALGVAGTVEILPRFAEGLSDLGGFSHIYLLYCFHRAPAARLSVVPFLDTEPRGVFATRAPTRPNPIGLSIVRLREVRGNVLAIENVDVLDGTPLLDIKPYVPAFDCWEVEATGWLERKDRQAEATKSDQRFTE